VTIRCMKLLLGGLLSLYGYITTKKALTRRTRRNTEEKR
jgi:hypothetical protein